jgi:hypothetical protein
MAYRIAVFVLGTVVCGLTAHGQQPANPGGNAPPTTDGHANGRFWKGIEDITKTAFIVGFQDGALAIALESTPKFDEGKALLKPAYPNSLSVGEIRAALNKFYETPENAPIQIMHALRVVALSANGGTDEEISALVRFYRAGVNSK